ncbi:transporter substrate-binding domain-containing protein [Pseudomonas aeruginosa]|nr:transporter substrate-binding domain-containing protein [Pseudomonas aeruginosa]
MRRRSLGLCILLGVGQAFAGELRGGFSPADGMPYVDIVDHQLQGGFTRQLGERVAQRLGLSLRFVETPNRRIDGFMASGHIHVICNSNPGWDSKPERYHWSPALFEEQDVLLQRDDRPAIRDFAELRGKTLGTSLGYVYADNLMQAFAAGEIRREDTRDLASRVQMLKRSRLDAAVDMRRPLLYLTRQHPELGLRVSPLVLQSYRMHCIYGGQLPVPVESMDRVLDEMVRDGSIGRLLENSLQAPQEP